jgi:hypothetical protein
MIKPIPPQRWETGEARQWVAQQLELPYSDGMQDWPWEVSHMRELEDYFQLYARAASDERVVIMEMMLNETVEQPVPEELHLTWLKIKELLDHNADLHASTAHYWCVWDQSEQAIKEYGYHFPISPYMREWWKNNYPIPAVAAS